jgi:hypothetical protein
MGEKAARKDRRRLSAARALCAMLLVVAGARSGAAGRFGPHPGDRTRSTATFLTAVLRYSCSLEQKAWAAQRMAQLSPPAPSDQTAR